MRIDERSPRRRALVLLRVLPAQDRGRGAQPRGALSELSTLEPAFVSVTYGAAAATRTKTIDIVQRIQPDFGLEAMAHFTCVGATADELRDDRSTRCASAGIENVLALRGDPPPARTSGPRPRAACATPPSSIELIRDDYDFAIGAACFPETHIHATSPRTTCATPRRRSTRARSSSSRSSSSTTRLLRLRRARPARSASTSRSSRASCRSRARPRSGASPSMCGS